MERTKVFLDVTHETDINELTGRLIAALFRPEPEDPGPLEVPELGTLEPDWM